MKTISKFVVAAFTSSVLLALPACDSGAKEEKPAEVKKQEAKAEAAKEEAKEEPKAEAEEEAEPAEGGGEGEIGIAECDEYVSKFAACVDKMPEAAQGPAKDGLKTMVDAWKQAADGPGKDALAQGCKTALEQAKTAYQAMGCEF